jgi:predicted Zn-dependent protease
MHTCALIDKLYLLVYFTIFRMNQIVDMLTDLEVDDLMLNKGNIELF